MNFITLTLFRCDLSDQGEGSQDGAGDGREAALLILATDGLWEFMTDQASMSIFGDLTTKKKGRGEYRYCCPL